MSRRTRPIPAIAILLALASSLPAQEGERVSERRSHLQVVEPDAGDRDLRMTPVVRAVQKSADTVVSIYLQSDSPVRGHQPVTQGQGSGVILDESGLLITNWHVIWPIVEPRHEVPDLSLEVRLRDGRSRPAVVLSHSKKHDLALLQIQLHEGEKVKPIEIGRSGTLMIGETMIAIGNPQGHANTVTTGVLSATERSIKVRAPDGQVREFSHLIQTDAAINQGNSGGALLDITGKLVGINNAMAMGAENIGFAIPVDLVREVFENELTRSSSFAMGLDTPWLGLEVVERDGTVLASSVLVGSPADRAGIEPGDVLVSVRNQPIHSSLDYQRMLVSAPKDRPIPLEVRRGRRLRSFEPKPSTRIEWYVRSAIGCEFEELTPEANPELMRRVTLTYYEGSIMRRVPMLPGALRVTRVDPDSPADGLLRPGDVVFAYVARSFRGTREQRLSTRRELHDQLRMRYGQTIKLAVLRASRDFYLTLDVRPINRR